MEAAETVEDVMKTFLTSLIGGVLAGASVWIADSFDMPLWLSALAGAAGAFIGTYAGQKLLHVS